MEGKFDITTFFRMVIPGYLFLLVVYTLEPQRPQWFEITLQSSAVLALVGLPIGYLSQEFYRCFLYVINWERRFDKRDKEYIAGHKSLKRVLDAGKESNQIYKGKDIFYYSTLIDYLLFTSVDPNLKSLNDHLRFLYTRMHSYGATAVAIFSGIAIFIVFTPESWTSKIIRIIFWGFIACALIYSRIETSTRISWWRRQIVDRNQPIIEGYFAKNLNPVSERA